MADIVCQSGLGLNDYFHFRLKFFKDPECNRLVGEVDSEDEWDHFFGIAPDGSSRQFTEQGLQVDTGECFCITYKMDPADHPELLGRPLYVKVKHRVRMFTVEGTSLKDTIFIFVVDDSGSMRDEHDWLPDMVTQLDAKLAGVGIESTLYGLTIFGRNDPGARIIPIGDDSLGTAAEAAEVFSNVWLEQGGVEDGYHALHEALRAYNFGSTATANVVLITDEDRDIFDSNVTRSTINFDLLRHSGAVSLNVVCLCDLADNQGNEAFGISHITDEAYIVEPAAIDGFRITSGGAVTWAYDNTASDYIGLGDTTWSLHRLREGGAALEGFTNAFIEIKTEEILELLICNDTVKPEKQAFFCPAPENSVSIDGTIVNDLTEGLLDKDGNPLGINTSEAKDVALHTRLSFFADAERKSLVDTRFSLFDQRRWYGRSTPNAALVPIGTQGWDISEGMSAHFVFSPEILPLELIHQQQDHDTGLGQSERPLVCGVTYHIDVDIYISTLSQFLRWGTLTYTVPCKDVSADFWRTNTDAANWISSGQGKSDFRITRTENDTVFPTIAANRSGQFLLAWQDHRPTALVDKRLSFVPSVFYGIWDTDCDIIWSSGQGFTDTKALSSSLHPKARIDQAESFYLAGHTEEEVFVFKCPLVAPGGIATTSDGTCLLTDDVFFDIDNTARAADQYLKMRIWETDCKGSFVISKDQVVSVTDDCLVKLDVVGVPGTIAIRLRNENQAAWSDWISIDAKLPGADVGEDITLDAYFIDDTRFLVPWTLSASPGMKRVCAQVLTSFGISNTFCIDILANTKEMDYAVEFFYDAAFAQPVPMYKGYPVITNRTEDSAADNEREIFVRVTFLDNDRLRLVKKMFENNLG